MKLHKYLLHGLLVGTFIFSLTSHAQTNYPNRPIRLIIPFTPGGVTDTSGRFIAEQLSLKLGQQVIADNRPGASGNIGTQMVAAAEPDGYTLLLGYAGTLSINPSLFDKISFDSVKDFAPIGKIGDAILIVVANNDFQGKTLADVIAISKKDPNGLSYGTSGAGGTPHIAGELLKQKTGANLVHVPYKGGGQALIDLLGGNIPLVYTAVAGANQYVKSGRIKAIAVSSAKRSPSMPDVPTFTESGIKEFEIDDWVGLLAPAKTPKPILIKLNQALNEILNSPEGKTRLLAMGITPSPGTPEKFGEQIKGDLIRFAPIVKSMQIKSE
ncbi:tripartite tricarboxylate transporter substrate binding protein [Polynucleobacter sp. IMCC30063]|uniref:Bug family tripartite tricarboxylate transporter substrate binding protein n=1 Tax=unclassified Polynucleobacter TaxID=2640945 RepID=UPI001F371107|nr:MULTISPECIES: tripartite tricarboxylate transporter substrate binding protein [unclassified Polynucleobacter]MCE7505692.1 tripartite tricarboxylate transporter substrate binding protein [Polynucleobacter sp. IMCC30063]MCE7529146.1 tripartite tricarboxylate transporter substrate binding protein [Polynucleobacter sp. IMCC 29146]